MVRGPQGTDATSEPGDLSFLYLPFAPVNSKEDGVTQAVAGRSTRPHTRRRHRGWCPCFWKKTLETSQWLPLEMGIGDLSRLWLGGGWFQGRSSIP